MNSLLDRFREHLEASQLIPPGGRVLVGFSGGADSTCLLHLLAELGIDAVAGHLNHLQRPEADSDVKHCSTFASALGLPFYTGEANVVELSREMGIGLEEAGRLARYEFLEKVARLVHCNRIATGHTRTDQAETVLHHLVRGSGLAGLAGIPESRGSLIRPLLPFGRQETRQYCADHGFTTLEDSSNFDIGFARARIRLRVLPELAAINPRMEEAIARTAEIARSEDRFLNGLAAAALERAEIRPNGDLHFLGSDVEVTFSVDKLGQVPEVVASRAVRLAVEALGAQLNARQTKIVLAGIQSATPGSITTEGGSVVVEWNGTILHFRELEEPEPYQIVVPVPGEVVSERGGWRLVSSKRELPGQTPTRVSLHTELDAGALVHSLFARNWKVGDTIRPLGFSGTRKVSDLVGEAKLTQAARTRLPIICDMLGPIWIPGIARSDRAIPEIGCHDVVTLRIEAYLA